ncbi:hypothetical protein BCF33_2752 [Hasllibacter halocynthiae]|uniref:Uncharacterized protein n=1 Tax=Hasllibacter halocynthiae TaxID=595589 RepID=A0A2T0WZD2_9RHOB|nr:hypothetical protein [Hasllibacter halocynthiae]PRY92058.1 hypothetical protein BCF33_2752 [Hasllibacter halocynthiae]
MNDARAQDADDERFASGFRLQPPERFPASLVRSLRASLDDGAGRIVRLWIEEMAFVDRRLGARLVVAAQIKAEPWDEAAHSEAEADLRMRVLDDLDHGPDDHGAVGEGPEIMVFAQNVEVGPGSLPTHFLAIEPVWGPHASRDLDLEAFRALAPAPRTLPKPRQTHPDQTSLTDLAITLGVAFAALVGLSQLAFWLIPSDTVAWVLVGLLAFLTVGFAWIMWQGSVRGSIGRSGPLRTLPLTLAHVVQAHEALREDKHPGYPDGARFGLVAVFTLDSDWRDDAGWLSWMARRLAHLRDHPTRSADETRIAQRLEGERDDGTSRIPASVSGNEATYWVSPLVTRDQLPERRIPDDELLPIVLEEGAAPGAEAVRMVRFWPAVLWPLAPRSDRARFVRPGT